MSDYYANPIPIPGGVTAPNVASLYDVGTSGVGGLGDIGGGIGSGLASRLGSIPSALSTFRGPTALGGTGELGLMGVAGKMLPPVLAGQIATAGINKVLPSTGGAGNARQVLGDAATWAGIGAGVGSVVPGLGTAAGGVAGGVAGGLYGLADSLGLFGGGDSNSPSDFKTQLAASAQQLGLNPNNYTAAFDVLTKAGADPKQLSVQLAQQLLSDSAQQQQIAQARQQQQQQQQADQRFALAMQSKAQEFFSPYVNNIITSGLSQSEALKGLASQLPAPYRDAMMNQAQQALGQSQRLAGAYAAQSALIPGQFMAQAELKRQQQLAQLQYQQAVIQAQQSKGGGSSNLNALLAQQAQGATPALAATPAG